MPKPTKKQLKKFLSWSIKNGYVRAYFHSPEKIAKKYLKEKSSKSKK